MMFPESLIHWVTGKASIQFRLYPEHKGESVAEDIDEVVTQ